MVCSKRNRSRLNLAAVVVGLVVALAAVLFACGLYRLDHVSREAVVYESVCRELLDNTTAGRQALVGSIWWPPFAVLARLPVSALFASVELPLSSLAVSALSGASLLALCAVVLRWWGMGRRAYFVVGAVAGCPYFLESATDGSSATLTACLVVTVVFALLAWTRTRKLRYLMLQGFGMALVLGMGAEITLWLVLALAIMVIDLVAEPIGRQQKEAVQILVITPACYVAALWVLMNWLIMGDALYFMRSLLADRSDWAISENGATKLAQGHAATAALAAVALLVGAVRGDRSAVFLGALALGPLVLAVYLESRGLLWNSGTLLLCQFVLVALCAGYLAASSAVRTNGVRWLLAALPLVLALVVAWPERANRAPGASADTFAAITADRNQWAPRIERHVLSRSRFSKVFVCGYDGFLFVRDKPRRVFLHALDFNFNKAREDYYGQRLYMLVRRPVGPSAMDSVHWKYGRIHALGSRTTLWDGDWGDWRLFEIIQAPRRIRAEDA